MVRLNIKYEYKGFGDSLGIYLDNNIFWGEVRKHYSVLENGENTFSYDEVIKKHFPQKLEELGYLQAHIESFLGMKIMGITDSNCKQFLNVKDSQIKYLKKMDTHYKFRVFPSSLIDNVRNLAAKHFVIGYNRACGEIIERAKNAGVDGSVSIREFGIKCVMDELKEWIPKTLYTEYKMLYSGVV